MNGTRANDYENTVVKAGDDAGRLEAGASDCAARAGRRNDFVLDEGGLKKGVVLNIRRIVVEVKIKMGVRGCVGNYGGCNGRAGGGWW